MTLTVHSRPTWTVVIVGTWLLACLGILATEGHPYRAPQGDLAEHLNNAARVVDGDRPYEDFWLLFPPGEVYLPAVVLGSGGGDLNVVLWFNVVQSALIGTLAFVLSWQLSERLLLGGLGGGLLFFAGSTVSKAGGYAYGHTYLLLCLLAFVAFARYEHTGRRPALIASGLCLGLGMLFRVFLVGAAGLAMLLALTWRSSRDANTLGRRLSLLALGPVLVGAVFSVVAGDRLPEIAREVVVESVVHGTGERDDSYSIAARPRHVWKRLSTSAENPRGVARRRRAFDEAAHMIAVPLGWLAWILSSRGRWHRVELGLMLWSLLCVIRIVSRADLPHLATVTTPMLVVFAAILGRGVGGSRRQTAAAVIVGVLSIVLLRPAPARLTDLVSGVGRPLHEVANVRGRFLFANKQQAGRVEKLLRRIEDSSRPGDPMFVTAWDAPPLYAWTGRRNPTRYDSMIDLFLRPGAQAEEICADLERDPPRMIVHQPRLAFGKGQSFETTAPSLVTCLADDFDEVERIGPWRILAPR